MASRTMGGMRRARVMATSAVLLAAVLVVAGCARSGTATDDNDTQPDVESSSSMPAGEGTTQYPFTIETWAGNSVLEERPERIAVLGFSPSFDALEVLGVTPVYIDSEEVYWWNDDEWQANVELMDPNGFPLNLEGVASTNPDLIVAINSVEAYEEDLDALLAIAPVLETKELAPAPDRLDWRVVQRLVGEALDLSAASEDVIAKAESAVAASAAEHPEFEGKTAAVAYDYTGYGMEFYNPTGSNAEGLLADLGFAPNPRGAAFTDTSMVSDENIAQLDADVLLVYYDDEAQQKARESMPVFQSIPAVREGRYIPVTYRGPDTPGLGSEWVLRQGASATTLPLLVDYIGDTLADGLSPSA